MRWSSRKRKYVAGANETPPVPPTKPGQAQQAPQTAQAPVTNATTPKDTDPVNTQTTHNAPISNNMGPIPPGALIHTMIPATSFLSSTNGQNANTKTDANGNPIDADGYANGNDVNGKAGTGGQGSSLDKGFPAAGLNSAFDTLYKIITIIVVLIFLMVVMFTFLDVVKYFWVEVQQRLRRAKEPNMYNKDTTDIEALKYISATNLEDEPYSIFKEQRFISYIFLLVGIMVIMMGIQLGMFFSFKIWSIFNGRVFNESVTLPLRLIGALLVVVIGAFMMKDTYKQRFVKKVQSSLVDMRSQLTQIRTYIFNNLSTDDEFLRALRTDNIEEIINIIRKRIDSKKGQPCNDSAQPCDTDIENMFFSLNLYSYIRYQIPPSDPNFDKVKSLFEPDGVRNRLVDPIMYFYYKQPIYVANLYPSMQDRLIVRDEKGKEIQNPFEGNTERERILLLNINIKMQELNIMLTRLHNLATGKVNVRTYLIVVALIALLFTFILVGLFYSELSPFFAIAKGAIKTLWEFLQGTIVYKMLFFWAHSTA